MPTIKVWKYNTGKIWTLDHRRLGAFNQAELNEIPIQWATPEEVGSQMWKMTTKKWRNIGYIKTRKWSKYDDKIVKEIKQ